jgi:pimeloyl-ACP methyl ester carboxylesterase
VPDSTGVIVDDRPVYAQLCNVGHGLAARMQGSGPTVLWLHDYSLNSAVWRDLWTRLPGYRHFGIDMPGHGYSLPLNNKEDGSVLAEKVAILASEYEARHVVGHGWGANFASQIVTANPGAFQSLTCISPLQGGEITDYLLEAIPDLTLMYLIYGFSQQLRERFLAEEAPLLVGLPVGSSWRDRLELTVAGHGWWDLPDHTFARLLPFASLDLHPSTCDDLLFVTTDTGSAAAAITASFAYALGSAAHYRALAGGHWGVLAETLLGDTMADFLKTVVCSR